MKIERINNSIRIESLVGSMYLTEHDVGEIVIWAKDHIPDIVSEIFSDGDVNVR